MGRVLLAFSTSLDGFITGPEVSIVEPMGRGGERLHHWLFKQPGSPIDALLAREVAERIGAAVIGRRTFEIGIGPWGDTPFPVPTFVVTHRGRPDLPMKSAAFGFVTEGIETALERALAAADGRDVVILGGDVARQYLARGRVDELFIQLVPVLMGQGTRLFEPFDGAPLELTADRVIATPAVTHLHYTVVGRA